MFAKFRSALDEMNLTDNNDGSYEYQDRICQVKFHECVIRPTHTTIPVLAVYTKGNNNETSNTPNEFQYIGVISNEYKFEGNDVIISKIKESLEEFNSPILHEFVYVPQNYYCMRCEILLRHQNNIASVGDVYPQICILNSYNGTGTKEINFGFSIYNGEERYSSIKFKHKIGKLRQTHIHGARTNFSSINSYIETFSDNIVNLFEQNYNNRLSDEDVLKTLDLIEKVGKKKRHNISTYLDELTQDTSGYVTSWNIFLAITKFSIIEKNINVKALLENVAERVLVLPEQMCSALI